MITAHCIVKNEENFVWFAINSILDYVNKMIIWDTGSTDKTVEIIKSIGSPKISFEEKGPVSPQEFAKLRGEMVKMTDTDWIFILDGDEVWHGDAVADLRSKIYDLGDKKDVVVVPNYMLIGDIFHYQEESAGKYKIGERKGHYNISAIRKTDGLHVEGIYPNEAYVTKNAIKVQDLDKEKILFLDEPYLHASFLKRSSKDRKKIKYEMGENFPKDFYYPEVFFKPRPVIVPSPWQAITAGYKLNAFWQTLLKKIKRRLI